MHRKALALSATLLLFILAASHTFGARTNACPAASHADECRYRSADTVPVWRDIHRPLGAMKAALIFGYLGFMEELRQRLLNFPVPASVTAAQWEKTISPLRDDDRWERKMAALVNRGVNNPFKISEDLRQQVTFWKNRRKDYAHAKRNAIEGAHVEMLWAFIRSNLPKFVVEGGSQALLAAIEQALNPSLTPDTADYSPLISKNLFEKVNWERDGVA